MAQGRYERLLVTSFYQCGFGVMRAPSSGSATEREMPDLIAGRPDLGDLGAATTRPPWFTYAYAIELKANNEEKIYIDPEEIKALHRFADRFGAIPRVGAKFKKSGVRMPFMMVDTGVLRETEKNVVVDLEVAEEEADLLVYQPTKNTDDEGQSWNFDARVEVPGVDRVFDAAEMPENQGAET